MSWLVHSSAPQKKKKIKEKGKELKKKQPPQKGGKENKSLTMFHNIWVSRDHFLGRGHRGHVPSMFQSPIT